MKILVTGAAGYIGKHVVAAALEFGHKVIASDIDCSTIEPGAKTVEVDIFSNDKKIYQKLGSPDVIIHMAWKHGFVHNSTAHMDELSNHVKFLRNCVSMGCGHVAVMGSMHEVGYWEGSIDENTPCNPLSQYGIAKDALRRSMLLSQEEHEFIFQWLRAYYIYGDDLKGNSVFSKIAQAVKDGKKEFPFTSGKNKYDFIHVNDLAKQIVAASTQDKVNGIINVCSGKPISLAEQVECYIKENNFDIKLKYGAFPDRQYDSPGVWGDSTKIKDILSDKF